MSNSSSTAGRYAIIQPCPQRKARPAHFPLSFVQEGLWLLQQLHPDEVAYNEPFAWRLTGLLDVPTLRRALNEIVRRHEILRTIFPASDGQPVQVVLPELCVALEFHDLSDATGPQSESEIGRSIREEVRRPFDLARGPLLRAKIFPLRQHEHILLLTFHHIIIDSWSLGTFCQELGALYGAYLRGEASPLAVPTIQYADFSCWQRDKLRGEFLQKQIAYWRQALAGDIPVLELRLDGARPAWPTFQGARQVFALSPILCATLSGWARRERTSLFMTLLAGFQTLLHRYTGQESFVVVTPIANRTRPELEGQLGCFANSLVIKAELSENPTGRDLLQRVRDTAFGAYEHQDLPFDKLVAELQPDRDLRRNPFMQAVIVFENAPAGEMQLPRLSVSQLEVDPGSAKFDLTLFLEEVNGGIRGVWQYCTDLFHPATIERMTGHFRNLLGDMAANPHQRLSQILLLTEAERHQILVEWNCTRREYPRDKSLQSLFEAQVQRIPGAVALIGEGVSLSYSELNERANQLAHYLREAGIQRNTCVGVLMERSLDYVIAVLGILKAGAAYVPLDINFPAARLSFLLKDAGLNIVIGRPPELAPELERGLVKMLDWPSLVEAMARFPRSNPESTNEAMDVAYVMYTSGSTGEPKGVEVAHRAVIRLVWGNDYLPFDDQQVFLLLAQLEFDASTLELWGPLLHGSKLVIYSKKELELAWLQFLLEQHQVTCLWLTSALFNTIVDQQPEVLSSVKNIMIGGEALSVKHVRRALLLLPTTQIANGYGPTEATTFSTTFAIPRNLAVDAQTVPIGRPIANTQVYLLDAHLQPVPVCVRGEIYIGGDGLARGYLNDPELTSGKFIPNPFQPDTRLYRTGDLGRFLPDGNIEFLGRNDRQVKIRGFRVEPGEIESVLNRHPAVREALVVVDDNERGDKRLVAYLTVTPVKRDLVLEFRHFSEQNLPIQMVPSAFVILDRFPLTPNGKVDRKALPPPEEQSVESDKTHGSPRTQHEQVLATIWQEVLGVKQVGIHDNFFDLGGHSLTAARVQARVERELGTRFPLVSFFQNPTIAELARIMNTKTATGAAPSRLLLLSPAHNGDRPPLFCFLSLSMGQRMAKHLGSARAVYGVEADLDNELRLWHERGQVRTSMVKLAAQCCDAIEQAQPEGPYCLAGLCFGGVLAFEVASQLRDRGAEVRLLALVDAVYHAGCSRLPMPQIRRWVYHAQRASLQGLGYLLTKLRKRIERQKRRRSQMEQLRTTGRRSRGLEKEPAELPREEFLSQLLIGYNAKPYDGDVLLFRTVAGPNSFSLDLGVTYGWHEVVRGTLHVEDLDCNHTDISEEPWVADVARKLEDYLLRDNGE